MTMRVFATLAVVALIVITGCASSQYAPIPAEAGMWARIRPLPEPTVTDTARNLELPTVGELPATRVYTYLLSIGDSSDAAEVRAAVLTRGSDVTFSELSLATPKPYQYTDHVFGYIAPPVPGSPDVQLMIVDAHSIQADQTLRGASVKITLDRLRVFDYPGDGMHQVLFDFAADHQATPTEKQTPHFNQIYRIQEGGQAGITGYPVFIGIKPANEGIQFKVSTVNVKNENDQRFLGFLNSDIVKGGLSLISGLNPAVPVLANFATGIATGIAQRNNELPVQDVSMGLDFDNVATRTKLRVGSYVAIQVPSAAAWDWSKWRYSFQSGQLVSAADPTQPVPYNYFVIGISKQ